MQILPLDEFFYVVKSYQIFYYSKKILKSCTDFAKYIEKNPSRSRKAYKKQTLTNKSVILSSEKNAHVHLKCAKYQTKTTPLCFFDGRELLIPPNEITK